MPEKTLKIPDFSTCAACALSTTRTGVVVGRGSIPADICIVGEGPGRSEDMLGKPFIGPSGKILSALLNKTLDQSGYSYFITNTVLCRPCDTLQGENREPRKNEIMACQPNVLRLLVLVNPRVILFAGNVAHRALRGKCKDRKQFKMYHPAAILRQGSTGPLFNHNIMILEDVIDYLKGEAHEEAIDRFNYPRHRDVRSTKRNFTEPA